MSSIENLWDFLGRKVMKWNDVTNVMDLERALHHNFEHYETLLCVAALGVDGGHTDTGLRRYVRVIFQRKVESMMLKRKILMV